MTCPSYRTETLKTDRELYRVHVSKSVNSPHAVKRLREEYDRRGLLVVDGAFAGPLVDRVFTASRSASWKRRFKSNKYDYGTLRSCELQERLCDPLPAGSHLCDVVQEEFACSLCRIATALANPAISTWCGRITRTQLEGRVTLMLSCYGPGSFLALHDDASTAMGYRLAFILYLNPVWDSAWGGHLRVLTRDGRWERVKPVANRLVLFAPDERTRHEVERVDMDAPTNRIAVSGWYLS